MTSTAEEDPLERSMAIWIPDWPIHAQRLEHEAEQRLTPRTRDASSALAGEPPHTHAENAPIGRPIALLASHRVVACSAAARESGIRIGMREREARHLCPAIELHPHHPETDERRFTPVLAAIERLTPGTEQLRPGLCVLRARGPARYYGDEVTAASALLDMLEKLGFPQSRVGIADGRFAAEQATRANTSEVGIDAPGPRIRSVPPGGSSLFLSALPISRAAQADLADVLNGLGIRTMGALAALPEDSVRQRFGIPGVTAHRLSSARRTVREHRVDAAPAREVRLRLGFEPQLDSADQLAFASSAAAERFVRELLEQALVCTEVRIELIDDIGIRYERTWAHPGRFTAADLVNRIRWQAGALTQSSDRSSAGIATLRVSPERVEPTAVHEPGLWSDEPDERVHHHVTRLQSLVGHDGALIGSLVGGRISDERQRFAPWGTRAPHAAHRSTAAGPWPGWVAGSGGPAPISVFSPPLEADLLNAAGEPILVDDEDFLNSAPASLRVVGHGPPARVRAWSAPWPVREQWWNARVERFRLQLALEDGSAWLLHHVGRPQRPPQPRPSDTETEKNSDPTDGASERGPETEYPQGGFATAPKADPTWFAEGRYD